MSVTHELLRSSVQNFNLLIIHFNLPSKKENNHSSFNSHDQIARYWQLLLSQQDNKAHFNLLSWILIVARGILWMIFSTRFKSALTCNNKFLWGGCLFFSNGGGQQSRVTFIQKHLSGNHINIFFSRVKNLCHHHCNVLELFVDCDNFHIPILCSLIVLSDYYLLSCFCYCCFKVHAEIPVNGCKLFPCFVNFVTVTQVWQQ